MRSLSPKLYLVVLGALNLYRAAMQSITVDEAFVANVFLSGDVSVLFRIYDAAYHVLHTWICWLFVHALGGSELVLRLPSVLAGFFYFAGVYRLCSRLFPAGARLWLAVVLLTANPLLLDHLSLARGYGLALAFFVWAFCDVLQDSHAPRAGIFLGLSVASNLTFAVPATVLVAFCWRRVSLKHLVLPAVVTAGLILAVPLSNAAPEDFYFGVTDLNGMLHSLMAPSLAHYAVAPPKSVRWAERAAFPLLLVVIAVTAAFARRDRFVLVTAGVLLGSLLLLVAAHTFLGVLYPMARTGLYVIWLFLAACLAIWNWLPRRGALPVGVLLGALAILFLAQLETRFYYEYRDQADLKQMVARLRAQHTGDPRQITVGGTWHFETSVNLYRRLYQLTWLRPMERNPVTPGYDYYLLTATDAHYAADLHLHAIWTGPTSGAVLAAPQ